MIFNRYLLFISCIMGLVEGLTEFLPISSTLHMFFVAHFLGLHGDSNRVMLLLLSVVLQLGAILSVVVVFWNHFLMLIKVTYFRGFISLDRSFLSCAHIVLGIFPIVVLGFFFYEDIKDIFKIKYMIRAFFFGSILLLISEWCTRRFYIVKCVSDINHLSYLQAFLIGCFQCLSLCPGFSRSGATIGGGLLVGVNRYVSTVFSFLLAVPVMFGASILVLYKNFFVIFSLEYSLVFIIGFLSAFIVSLIIVKIFLKIIQYVSFVPFIIYRFIFFILIYLLNF